MKKEDKTYITKKDKGKSSTFPLQPRVVSIKLKIDQILKKDIQLIKNPRKQSISHLQLQIANNNQLLNQYISNNYQQYKVPDPMPNLSKDYTSNQPHTQPKKIRKHLQLYSVSMSKKSQFKIKSEEISGIKTKGRTNTEANQIDKKYDSIKTRLMTQGGSNNQPKGSRPIVHLRRFSRVQKSQKSQQQSNLKIYQSKQNYFNSQLWSKQNAIVNKSKANDSLDASQQIKIAEVQQKLHPQLTFQRIKIAQFRTPTEQKHLQTQQVVSQSYRYCIGCDNALLEVNIKYHQSICQDFKNVFLLDLNQLGGFLNKKIINIQQKVKKCIYLSQTDHSNLRQSCSTLLSACLNSRKCGYRNGQFVNSHRQVCSQFASNMQLLQNLAKLNWFFRVKQNLAKKLII